MSEYQNPIKVRADDPICTASALGNSIIGILFDKKGSEIKTAITARIKTIDNKIQEYGSVIEKIEGFIKGKERIIKDLDDYNQERRDKKEALLKPFNRNLDEIRKEFNEKIDEVNKKMKDFSDDFENETLKEIGKEAAVFEESFDAFKDTFSEIDEFLEKENENSGYSGMRESPGFSGISGYSELQSSDGTGTVTCTDGTSTLYTINNSVGLGNSNPTAYSPTKEDGATARLSTLKRILWENFHKIDRIKTKVQQLEEEKRRLDLIANNIDPIREYKLDLNKLSAFGFEDIVSC